MQLMLGEREKQWKPEFTMDRLWTMQSTILASDGSLSRTAQTTCLIQMLPEGDRKSMRGGAKTDTVRGSDLWLIREPNGNIREARADESPPTWVLKQPAQPRR